MTISEHVYDQQLFREAEYPRHGRVAEIIEFHPDMSHTDPVVIFDREHDDVD